MANLAARIVPSLSVNLCPSDLAYTTGTYQALGRRLTPADVLLLADVGYTEHHVIESVFTSSLKPQEEQVTREELRLPKKSFLMTVVGARLDDEVTDDFLQLLEEVLTSDMYVVFWGTFNGYEQMIHSFPKLQKQSAYLGFCSDILSRLEVCDLYINPTRKGGGTSAVEAMFQGLPVITVDYGDVAVNAGSEFCVKDYAAMRDQILHYYTDTDFYEKMSAHARERAELLLNSEQEFVKIIQEMDRREAELLREEGQNAGL